MESKSSRKAMKNDFNVDIFRMGYIIAYMNRGDWIGNMIVNRQVKEGFDSNCSQITHIEISGGGIHSINVSPPRARLVEITKVHRGRYAYLLRYKNDDYEKRGRYKVAYFSATLNNQGYDIPGILSFLSKWIKQNNRLWFCSEGALWALQTVYSEAMDYLPPEYCMPAHFLSNTKHFEVVWNGYIPK